MAIRGARKLEEFKALIAYAAPYRWRLTIVGILMLANSAATLAVPWILGHLAGNLIMRDAASIAAPVAILLGLLIFLAILSAALRLLSGETAWRILADLQLRIHDHLQSLPLAFHQAGKQGNLLALITREVPCLSDFLTSTLVSIPPLLVTTLGAIVVMLQIDPLLTIAVPLLVPGFYLMLKLVGWRLRRLARDLQRAEADFVGIAEQNLEMLPVIKMFTRERLASSEYAYHINQSMTLSLRINRIHALIEPLAGLVAAATVVLLLVLADGRLQSGEMSPGQLISFLLYAALLTRPVGKLADVYGQINTARGTLQRMQAVFDRNPEPEYVLGRKLGRVKGGIEFCGVDFAYPDRQQILQGLNLNIGAGETVALTGVNGAGKSTIVALLLRLHDPDNGVIKIDGEDIAAFQVQDLRRQIGIVPQETFLFNGTVGENIAFGKPEASDREIVRAAKEANALDFIKALSRGFDTPIGDNGVCLSGGQRQRIALARALLKDPPILVLDEANSMYDQEGESAFIEFCTKSSKRRTLILITHREASLKAAERILFLECGSVHEIRREC